MELRKTSAFARLGVLLAGCCMVTAAHADDIYFTITGATQGKISGDVFQKGGLDGAMRGAGFELDVSTDTAEGSALATKEASQRRYKPVTLLREPGRGSAQLFHAYVRNENLTSVKIDFYTPRLVSGTRAMVPYQTIKLTNAKVVGFERSTEPAKDTSTGLVRTLEEVKLSFQTIEVIDLDANVSATDSLLF
jgi:type VI secretion system Hcp family effector